jgi:diguanylate cyclase (GGDEF)-like protein/PAS domain S-box-containing protein
LAVDRGNEKAGETSTDIRDFSDIWEVALAGSGTGIWDCNIVTSEIRYSATWFALFGYSYETPQLHIEEFFSKIHPDDRAHVQAVIQAHFDQQTAFFEVEYRIRCKDGSYKWALCRGGVTQRADGGSPLRMVGTTTDVSATRSLTEQLKRQNAKLRDNAAKLSAVTRELAERTRELKDAHRLAKIGLWRWDVQDRSIHLSRELRQLIGLPPSETSVTYDQIKLLHHPDDYHDALAAYYKALHTKEPVTLECRLIYPDGIVRNVLTHVEPIMQADGSVTQLRGTSQNITAYRNIEAALRDSEDRYRHVVELHPQIPWTAGPDGGILEVGSKWYQFTGLTPEETLPCGWITAVHPDDRLRVMALWRDCVASGRPLDCEYRINLHDGRNSWFRARAAARLSHQGEILRWYGTLEDITDRRRAEATQRASETLAFRVLEATKDAVIVFDRSGRVKYANAQATDLFCFRAPLTNLCIGDIFQSVPQSLLTKALKRGVESGESSNSTFYFEFLRLWVEANIYADAENVSLFLRDISDKRRAEEQLNYAARHDFLTGILNRGEFFARLQETIARHAPGQRTAMFCLDVDNFKGINDVHGHPIGDGLLQQIVERLSPLLHPNDLLARSGGNEFMLAQTGITTEGEAEILAEHIIRTMGRGFRINDLVIATSMSIGVAITTPDVTDVETIYKQADIALYQSKTNAKGNYRFFHPDMQEKFDRAHRLRLDLMMALKNEELYLEFQPIIRTSDGTIDGAEALLRWQHPTRGLISPTEFIPIAEDSGLICEIGSWVLHQACAAAQKWSTEVSISVNVSPRQFELGDIVQTVADALRHSGLAPERLKLEITESVFISKESANLYMMNELQNLGLNLVLDDFGTGYSSLSYLDTFRFDLVKIDRSFIAKSSNAEETQPLLEAIIGITTALKLPVTAEGVETHEQFERVRKLGCQYAQGYLFGKPMAEATFLQWLQGPRRAVGH